MTWWQVVLAVQGVLVDVCLVALLIVGGVCWGAEKYEARKAREAAIAGLLRASKTKSRWIVTEETGRG